ncbi:MAG: TraR/DksA C4-type zinc finger protein [Candidatus Omnitrophica bacterium]|nr:TraR/DksA C4-type zinc finger protein [Candidatus Omnitrophota bacterium]
MPKKTQRRKVRKSSSKKKATRSKGKLSKKEAAVFKKSLVKEKISLLQGINHLTNETLKKSQREASGDLSGYAYHMADMASDVYERDLLLKLASGERELLFKIDEALRRIEEGKYGSCASCDKKISKTRLRAISHTIYCRECQEKEEKKQ